MSSNEHPALRNDVLEYRDGDAIFEGYVAAPAEVSGRVPASSWGTTGAVRTRASARPALGDVVATSLAVGAAWLFGSVATGSSGPLSDVDVAVLGRRDLSLDDRAELAAELSRAVGRAVDVVCVEQASPALGPATVDEGRPLLCRDVAVADAWEDFALRRYVGTAELRRIVYGYACEDLRAL
jgi:uncharacterized protein